MLYLGRLEKDWVAREIIAEFDMSGGRERKLLDNIDMSLAFSERKNHEKSFLFVDVQKKPTKVLSNVKVIKDLPKMEEYLHPYYSVYHFRIAYDNVIKPLTDNSPWVHMDPRFKVLPPLTKRLVGRQRKLRQPSCLEDKGNKPRDKGN
jgi:hypothetical protein